MKEKMKIENLESDSIELLKRATKEAQQGIRFGWDSSAATKRVGGPRHAEGRVSRDEM